MQNRRAITFYETLASKYMYIFKRCQ